MNQIIQGDCLKVMAGLPDNSVDLICTDPPFFKCKQTSGKDDLAKFNWWDHQWDKPEGFLSWIDQLAAQWQRILKPNGSLYCFASPRMAARVEVQLGQRFNVVNRITWQKPPFSTKAEMFVKEDLRGFFPASEAIIFCEHYGADNMAKGEAGYEAKCGELHQKIFARAFGDYLAAEFERAGVTRKAIAALFPSRNGNLTGCVSNWVLGNNCPSKEQYEVMRDYLNNQGGEYLRREYEDLRREYEDLRREYEDLRRPFAVSAEVPYTDVWTFATVQHYPGKHVCEKPAPLLEHIISASSRPGAVVLDCFAGSGSTLIAAKKLGRQYIGIEIDPHWVDVTRGRLGEVQEFVTLEQRTEWLKTQTPSASVKAPPPQLSIFDILSA